MVILEYTASCLWAYSLRQLNSEKMEDFKPLSSDQKFNVSLANCMHSNVRFLNMSPDLEFSKSMASVTERKSWDGLNTAFARKKQSKSTLRLRDSGEKIRKLSTICVCSGGETIEIVKRLGDWKCRRSGLGALGLLAKGEGVKQLRSSGVPNCLLTSWTNNVQLLNSTYQPQLSHVHRLSLSSSRT